MSSLKVSDLAAYRAYAERNSAEWLSAMHFGAPTLGLISGHANVLGKLNLAEFTVSALSKRYSETFAPVADAIAVKPRFLEVQDAKIDLRFVPKRWERQYLAYLESSKRDPAEWPLLAWIMSNKLLPKIQEERQIAAWQGEAAAVPASTDLLIACVDGFHKIIADEITATTLTPVTTGAISVTNAVSSVEGMYAEVGDVYQNGVMDVFMGSKVYNKFLQNYRNDYGKFSRDEHGRPQLDIGTGMDRFHKTPGMADDAILITKAENMHYGYANGDDHQVFQMETEDRSLKMWMDYKIGFNFGIVDDDIIVVNDKHASA